MKGSQSVAWNDDKVLLGMTNSYNDPIDNITKFFSTTSDNSIAGDKDLQKAMSGNHDITSWMSSNAMANSASLKNLQDALMEDINIMFKDKVSTDFSSYIPATANSAMAVSLDLEGVQSVLQKKGVLMMANFGLKEYGLTVEDISSTFSGDILLYSTPGSKDTPRGSFATTINNKDNLDKFLALANDYKMLTKVSDNLYSINNTSILSGEGFNGRDAQLIIKDDMVFVSADPAIIEKVASGGYSGKEKIDKSKVKSLRSNIFSGFADFGTMMERTGGKDLDLNFDNMDFSTNRKNSIFNMNFKDKNSNGLKQLFESINEIYLADKRGEI